MTDISHFILSGEINSFGTYGKRGNRTLHSTQQKKKYYLYDQPFVLTDRPMFRYSFETVQSDSNVEK